MLCPRLKKPVNGRIYYETAVCQKLADVLATVKLATGEKKLFQYLLTNINNILAGDVSTLDKVIFAVQRILKENRLKLQFLDTTAQKLQKTNLHELIVTCFDYEAFSQTGKPYEYLLLLNVQTCPYCNRQFINTYYSKNGKTRATLDHFYSKERYPYLALSLYNLVPSCYSCNSSLKGSKHFTTGTHIHPFVQGFDGLVKFTIDYTKSKNDSSLYIAEFYANADYMEIDFVYPDKADKAMKEKAKKNIEELKLKELYQFHKDFVVELLQKEAVYAQSGYAATLARTYPKLFKNEHDILKMLLGTYSKTSDFHKRPLSRLLTEIAEELKLTDELEP